MPALPKVSTFRFAIAKPACCQFLNFPERPLTISAIKWAKQYCITTIVAPSFFLFPLSSR